MAQPMDLCRKVEFSTVSKSLANVDPKMITGAVTSTANTVISSTFHIRLCILTLSRNIAEVPMAKLCRCLRVAGVEDGQRSCAPLLAPLETIRIMDKQPLKEQQVVLEDA